MSDFTVVVNDQPVTVTVQDQPARVVSVGTQGPAGPTGATGATGPTPDLSDYAKLDAANTFTAPNSTATPVTVKGASGQSADLLEFKDSTGAIVAKLDNNGNATFPYLTCQARFTLGNYVFDTYDGFRVIATNGLGFKVGGNGDSYVFGLSAYITPLTVQAASGGQVVNLQNWIDGAGIVAAAVTKNGGFKPAQMSDTDAENSTIFYSTAQSKLCFKDSSGAVNPLY